MITESGQVVAEQGDQVWVQTIRQSACQSCQARQGCGQKLLAEVSGGRANQVAVDNHLGARVGDRVTLGIPEAALLQASLLVYGLPLVLFVAGTLCGDWLLPNVDGAAVVSGLAGLGVGFVLARRRGRRLSAQACPRLLRIDAGHDQVLTINPTDP